MLTLPRPTSFLYSELSEVPEEGRPHSPRLHLDALFPSHGVFFLAVFLCCLPLILKRTPRNASVVWAIRICVIDLTKVESNPGSAGSEQPCDLKWDLNVSDPPVPPL